MEKRIFKNPQVDEFVKGLIQQKEDIQKYQEELDTKIKNLEGSPERQQIYVNLKNENKFFEKSITEMIEHYFKDDFYNEEKHIEEYDENITEEEYWNELMKAAPEESAHIEDLIAYQESIEDALKFAENADRQLQEIEKDAELVIQSAEEIIDKDPIVLANEYQESLNDIELNLSDEAKENINEIMNELSSYKNVNFNDLSKVSFEDMEYQAKIAIAKHPIKYAVQSLRDTMNEIKEARLFYKSIKGDYLEDFTKAEKSIIADVSAENKDIQKAVAEVALSSVGLSATLLNDASMKFIDFVDNAGTKLKQGIRAIVKFEDKLADCITLGLHSKLLKYNSKMNDKNLSKFPTWGKYYQKMEQFFRGDNIDEYCKEITDNAFFWGEQEESGYVESPAQMLENGIKKGIDKVGELGAELIIDCKDCYESIRNMSLNYKVNLLEKSVKNLDKKETKINTKAEQLNEANKKLFEINEEKKKIIHQLNSVAPYKKAEFIPNEEISSIVHNLNKMKPSVKRDFILKIMVKEIQKQERIFNKNENRKEKEQELFLKKASKEKAKFMSEVEKNIEKTKEITQRLKDLHEKSTTITTERETINKNIDKINEKLGRTPVENKENVEKNTAFPIITERYSDVQEIDERDIDID